MQPHHPKCPNIVCIRALGLDAVPLRGGKTLHLERLADAGQAWETLPPRWQMARLASFGYHTALIGGGVAANEEDAMSLGDEAARFIASRQDEQPFVLSLALPCSREPVALQRFDRAVGQVLTALEDWGHEQGTVVLLGPVRRRRDAPETTPSAGWFDELERHAVGLTDGQHALALG